MALRVFFFSAFLVLSSISWSMAQDSSGAADIYSGGKRYRSFDAYHKSEKLINAKADQGELFDHVPIKVDAAKVKTVTINPDGTKSEQIGPQGLWEDVPVSPEPLLKTDPQNGRGAGKLVTSQEKIVDQGRVAGVEPAFDDILQGLDQGAVPKAQVSSQEDIRRDLEARMGHEEPIVLIVSDHKKARVMELKEGPHQGESLLPVESMPQKP